MPTSAARRASPVPTSIGASSFANLVKAHYNPLFRFAWSLTRNGADASDLTQQTFLIWARKGGQLRDPAKVKSWLFTTLHREFLLGHRRASRLTSLHDLPPAVAEIPSPPADLDSRLDAALLSVALQGLPENYRAPLILYYVEHQSYRAIAAALNLPIGTVMNRLFRAKARLRHILLAN